MEVVKLFFIMSSLEEFKAIRTLQLARIPYTFGKWTPKNDLDGTHVGINAGFLHEDALSLVWDTKRQAWLLGGLKPEADQVKMKWYGATEDGEWAALEEQTLAEFSAGDHYEIQGTAPWFG